MNSTAAIPAPSKEAILLDGVVVLATITKNGKKIPHDFAANPDEAFLAVDALPRGHAVAEHPEGGLFIVKLS